MPNPLLKKEDGSGYYPAHMLLDWTAERAGRIPKRPANASASSGLDVELRDFSQAQRKVRRQAMWG